MVFWMTAFDSKCVDAGILNFFYIASRLPANTGGNWGASAQTSVDHYNTISRVRDTNIVCPPEPRGHQNLSPVRTFSCFVFSGCWTKAWRTRLASAPCHSPPSWPQPRYCPRISLSGTCPTCWRTCSAPSWRCSGRWWAPTARPAVCPPWEDCQQQDVPLMSEWEDCVAVLLWEGREQLQLDWLSRLVAGSRTGHLPALYCVLCTVYCAVLAGRPHSTLVLHNWQLSPTSLTLTTPLSPPTQSAALQGRTPVFIWPRVSWELPWLMFLLSNTRHCPPQRIKSLYRSCCWLKINTIVWSLTLIYFHSIYTQFAPPCKEICCSLHSIMLWDPPHNANWKHLWSDGGESDREMWHAGTVRECAGWQIYRLLVDWLRIDKTRICWVQAACHPVSL